ncbi:cytochrome d ubiquinol oxidase subunit II [Vagococcus penaei]|uniref:Cytochrome d ubiquinol oxidase subunit II n=1 Tax=Vagococcus penaei TaxID=633807 RepID=A0A1Q2D5P8_9ENTE|nr:cytochrome d ubiquinol oxidase subunit II [Vagococcus penaei]AQP53699.1 cytochrome d ubiquinol oxidase subunit II [Vagococcus penaei]RST99448.1 cytochrome d ubiquinol oxidase subunit II [Vagococcus penaei]
MTTLELIWFILIGVLFSGFFFLEGFDFGVGMAVKLLARNKRERDQVIETIGPVWDGNEVWLITAGGAMFASFPEWYATLFSGFYIILLLILVGLILRGVSFEFRAHSHSARERNIWEWTMFIGSIMPPFLFGMMFIDVIQGMPIAADKNIMEAGFGDYVNLFSIVGGVAVTLICFLHGLNYIRLKTAGKIRERAHDYTRKLYPVLFVGLVVFAVLAYLKTDFFTEKPVTSFGLLAVIVILAIISAYGSHVNKELMSFLATGLMLVGIVVFIFNGLFPRVMIANDPSLHMLIENSANSAYTLKTMTIVTVCILPFVLAYQSWSYYVFSKRIHINR